MLRPFSPPRHGPTKKLINQPPDQLTTLPSTSPLPLHRPWSKQYDDSTGCVTFVNDVTGGRASTLEEVHVANELNRAPDPGDGWAKEW